MFSVPKIFGVGTSCVFRYARILTNLHGKACFHLAFWGSYAGLVMEVPGYRPTNYITNPGTQMPVYCRPSM